MPHRQNQSGEEQQWRFDISVLMRVSDTDVVGVFQDQVEKTSVTECPTNPTAPPRIPAGACSGAAVAVETRPADCYVD
ncbi:hypothetical protein Bca52824_047966 [Brassica carinata]|uniref:Uncharacterized protein n=1 Tax=Brassica carinata TaxID=52824 RepID=A0A8X7URR2_BRACI|nr:hypothetical protein Bca52824_047966 [Brassica carinata]